MYSQVEIEMMGQLDMVRHPEVGFGLLLVMLVLTATAIAPAADDIALAAVTTAHDIGIALVVVFAELQFGEHLPWSPRLQ
jgi:hypothetical protein